MHPGGSREGDDQAQRPPRPDLVGPGKATPAYFGGFLRDDLDRTRRAVRIAGLRPEYGALSPGPARA